MVDAYQARRALDYLMGFSLSPVLWKTLPRAKSAGRVQSVALKLICDRETEREKFSPKEYWTISSLFKKQDSETFSANLTILNSNKLKKFDINNKVLADNAVKTITEVNNFNIDSIQKKRVKNHPTAPFITSTLQQEASRKLGIGAKTLCELLRVYMKVLKSMGKQ